MRNFLALCLALMVFNQLTAQNDTTVVFYNWKGQPTNSNDFSKYSLRVKQADHYMKIMMDGKDDHIIWVSYFTDSACSLYDGPFKELYKNGGLNTWGQYRNNRKVGVWKSWAENAKLTDSVFYNDGFQSGLGLRWNADGRVIDSMVFEEPGSGFSHSFWSSGQPSQRGNYVKGKKEGAWTYYFRNGNKSQEVQYLSDSAISFRCYDEQGKIMEKDCIYEQEAFFPGGEVGWRKYLEKNLPKAKLPNDYYKGKIWGQVLIQFVVDIDGSIKDIQVRESDNPQLEKPAIDIIRNCPKWTQAVQFNRPVKAYRLQPITFARATSE